MTKEQWRRLEAAVMVGLFTAIGTSMSQAADYGNKSLTGTVADGAWLTGGSTVKQDGDILVYDLKGDNSFSGKAELDGGYDNAASLVFQAGQTRIKTEGTLTLTPSSNAAGMDGAGIIAVGKNDTTAIIDGNIKGRIDDTSRGDMWGLFGISMSNGNPSAEDTASHLTINGNVDLSVTTTGKINGGYSSDGYTGSRWAPAGIYAGIGGGSSLNFNGALSLSVRGIGVETNTYYTYPGYDDYDATTVNLNGGTIQIKTPDSATESYYSLASFGGTINVNVSSNGMGTNAKDYQAGTQDVVLKGNVIAMNNKNGDGNPYYYRNGRINIGLTTKNSYWTGIADNTGTDQAGEVNLWLQNGAQWNHEEDTPANGMDAAHMPSPSNGHYGTYDGASHIHWLRGGDTGHGGFIIQSKDALDIANYSGYTTVIYDHKNSGIETGDYIGGSITIGHAEKGAQITLSTSSKNIDTKDNDQVGRVLNALAGKLIYRAYTEGEENLFGKVQIASGLTSSAAELVIGDIVFDKTTGQGGNESSESAEETFHAGITGDPAKDTEYKDVIQPDGSYQFKKNTVIRVADAQPAVDLTKDLSVSAKGKVLSLVSEGEKGPASGLAAVVNVQGGTLSMDARQTNISMDRSNNAWATGMTMGTMESPDRKGNLKVSGDMNINVAGGDTVMGMYLLNGSQAVIDGDLAVSVQNRDAKAEGDLGHYHTNGLYAGFGKSSITVTGDVDIAANGSGIQANANSRIDIQGGGKVILTADEKADQYALIAEAAAVNMNVVKDANGQVTGAGKKGVQIKGNLGVLNKDTGASPNLGPAASVVNLGLSTKDSTLQGIAFNEFAEQELAGKDGVSSYARAADTLAKGEINLYIANGASWTNEAAGMVKDGFTGSKVNILTGGSDAAHAGYILQKDRRDISIDTYSGHMVVVYDHENDGAAAGDYKAGNTVIRTAAAGSGIIASTSSKGIAMDDRVAVEKTLTALASKLAYTAADENLKGEVQIASGLTTGAAVKKLGDMMWDVENGGMGSYVEGSVKDVAFEVGNTESYMMKGVRSAAVTSYLSFRDAAADVLSRSRFLREGTLGEGVWAKTYGGKSKYDGADLSNAYNYWGAQVGYSKVMENGWTAGIGLDYQDGSSDYILGGSGDNTLYTLGIYLGKDMGDGAYFDAAVKAGHVENDFHVYNEIGEKLSGTYSANGYSTSVQVGKRIGGDSYIEPQVQLTYAHLQPSDYDTYSGLGTMHVEQDAYDSLVGRIGLEIGNQTERGGFYGRVSIAHEFMADIGTDYSDSNGGRKHTSYDLGDTWGEFTLGGTYQLNEDSRIYADLTRSIGGDYQNQWKANAGVRIFMGSGVAPGSRNHAAAALPRLPAKEMTDTAPAGASPAVIQPAPAVKEQKEEAEKVSGSAMGDVTFVSSRPAMAEANVPAEEASAAHSGGPAETGYTAPAGVPNGTVFELAPVVVTANRTPQPILEAKADISVVERKEIEDMHMGTVEEALRTVPGVQFTNYGANGLNSNLSGIRINGSKDIVVLIDGVRITDFQGVNQSGYVFAALRNNMDNIERIEVLKGSAGTLYGSAAKGGVINIITRKVNATKSVIDMSAGNFGKENYRFNTQGRKDKFSYNLYYDKTLSGDMKDGAGIRWHGHTNTKSGGGKFTYDFNENSSLSVGYDEMSSKMYGFDRVYQGPYDGTYEFKAFTLQHDWKISDLWHNTFSYRNSKVKSYYNDPDPESDTGRSIFITDYKYDFISDQATYTADRHTLTFGLDYSRAKDNGTTAVIDSSGKTFRVHRTMSNISYYAQDDWKIFPSVTLTGGIRYDQPDGDSYSPDMDSHTSKSYKLSWDITDKDTVYAGRSDFYILPSVDQIYNDKFGNAKLQPAYGRTTTIGYNREFSAGNMLTVNWYTTDSTRGIGYEGDGTYVNYEGGIARGWNAQYITQIDENWSTRLGWAHLFQYAEGDTYSLGYYPKDMATFGIYYNKDKWTGALDGFYFIRRVNPKYADVQGWPSNKYGVFNLSASYSPNRNLTVYAKVENLFDKLWAEHTHVIWGGGPENWYSQPGRSFLLGMQMKF